MNVYAEYTGDLVNWTRGAGVVSDDDNQELPTMWQFVPHICGECVQWKKVVCST